jgi:hypothetical protein
LKLTQLEQEVQRVHQQVRNFLVNYSAYGNLILFYRTTLKKKKEKKINYSIGKDFHEFLIFFCQGIFISSSGSQTNPAGGNGMSRISVSHAFVHLKIYQIREL